MSRKVLGKGLDALIPRAAKDSATASGVTEVAVRDIQANPHQPRKHFDSDALRSLAESIEHDGVLQPVVVRKSGAQYELIMGERRLQAARLAGLESMPVVIKPVEEVDALRLALVENLQREDLNPIEIAEAYRALVDKFGLSQTELAQLVARDRSSVANTLRLLGLPEEIRTLVVGGKISEGHARALLALPTKSDQLAMARRIQADHLSVRQVEAETHPQRKRKIRGATPKEKPAHIAFLEDAISRHLATRVTVEEKRNGKGRLIVEFYSHEDFERVAELMRIPLPR